MPTLPPEKLVPGVRRDEFEELTFHVQSSENPEKEYRVDMKMYCGNGWCGCPNFEFTKQKKLEAGAWPSKALQCKHIDRVDRYIKFLAVNPIIKKIEEAANEIRQKNQARRMDGRKWGEASPKPVERAKGKAVAPAGYEDDEEPAREEMPF